MHAERKKDRNLHLDARPPNLPKPACEDSPQQVSKKPRMANHIFVSAAFSSILPSSEHARWVLATFEDTLPVSSTRYFVDLAANHPQDGSSTNELEKNGWNGLCIEPNPAYVPLLRTRRRCQVVDVAIDDAERNVSFAFSRGPMGGIIDRRFDNQDVESNTRQPSRGNSYIRAIPLHRALRSASAPNVIDYLSLDVEGAESSVLPSTFPWEEIIFLTLTIERPPPDLNSRLFQHGYLYAKTIGYTDTAYVHKRHPRAAQVSANHSFVQVSAKCRNHGQSYSDRSRIHGQVARCRSMFGCCTFPGYPQSTTTYGVAITTES